MYVKRKLRKSIYANLLIWHEGRSESSKKERVGLARGEIWRLENQRLTTKCRASDEKRRFELEGVDGPSIGRPVGRSAF